MRLMARRGRGHDGGTATEVKRCSCGQLKHPRDGCSVKIKSLDRPGGKYDNPEVH